MSKERVRKFNYIKGDIPAGIEDKEKFWQQVQAQAKLVLEEAQEQYDGAMARDLVEVVDGAGDVFYVQTWMDTLLDEAGINMNLVKGSVCMNNDQKYTVSKGFAQLSAELHADCGTPCYVHEAMYEDVEYYCVRSEESGKVLKLSGHIPPNIRAIIPDSVFEILDEKVMND